MATFEVTTPDGTFEVTAPDEQAAMDALRKEGVLEAASAPDTRSIGTRVDDFGRGMADMMSFGFADEASAGLNSALGSGDYASNVAKERARDAAGGWERFGGQVAGALLMPGKLAASIPAAIGKGIAGGGIYGFGSGEGSATERLPSAGVGAIAGGAAGGLLRGGTNMLQTRAAAKTIPTNEQLRAGADAAYKAADDSGVIFRPEGIKRMANDIRVDLAEFGFHPKLQPRVAVVLDELETLQNGNVTMKGMDVLRRIADSARKSADPSEQALGNKIVDRIDEFMMDAAPEEVLTGNAAGAGRALQEGRDLWGRLRRSERIDTAALKAERRAASTNSGANLDNTLRQNVRGILDNPKLSRGMPAAEKAAAERVVRGSVPQNILRSGGKKLSGTMGAALGGGIGSLFGGAGGAAAGAVAVPAIGRSMRGIAEGITEKNAARLSQIIRSGGKTAKELAALARNDNLSKGQVYRIEQLAKSLGISVPQLAAAVADRLH